MGVSLSYWTITAVDPRVRRQIEDEAGEIERDWWCEPLHFFDWPGKPGLAGDTKLFFASGYSTTNGDFFEVEIDDDVFLAARDARFIVDRLCAWSATHGLIWELVCEAPIGRITSGKPDAQVTEFIDGLAARGHLTGSPADDARGQALLAKYASRL